jgi:hypothetical protein
MNFNDCVEGVAGSLVAQTSPLFRSGGISFAPYGEMRPLSFHTLDPEFPKLLPSAWFHDVQEFLSVL